MGHEFWEIWLIGAISVFFLFFCLLVVRKESGEFLMEFGFYRTEAVAKFALALTLVFFALTWPFWLSLLLLLFMVAIFILLWYWIRLPWNWFMTLITTGFIIVALFLPDSSDEEMEQPEKK